MILRRKTADPNFVLRLGLVFLILASMGRYFLRPGGDFSQGMVDGATGFLQGIAIGTLLLAAWMGGRRDRRTRDQ